MTAIIEGFEPGE